MLSGLDGAPPREVGPGHGLLARGLDLNCAEGGARGAGDETTDRIDDGARCSRAVALPRFMPVVRTVASR